MTQTILLVDDEIQLLSLLSDVLISEGYNVVTACNGQEAVYEARQSKPDLIILDVMMEEMDGYDFLQQYRREYDTPIIMLTAKVDEVDKVLGLWLGADDYVTKPFSTKELVARVGALLRRAGGTVKREAQIRAGDLFLDYETRLVKIDEKPVELTRTEFSLLARMMSSPGRVYSRFELLQELQGEVIEGYERTVDVHIKNLRSKMRKNAIDHQYIETVYGIGYRLNTDGSVG